jgi:hypothetical protein
MAAQLTEDRELFLNPRANLPHRARQRPGTPCFQLVLLLRDQAAQTAFASKPSQPFDPILFVQPMPRSNRAAADEQKNSGFFAAHVFIQQNQHIRASPELMLDRSISRQLNQSLPRPGAQKTFANHLATKIPPQPFASSLPDSQGDRV